MRLVLIALAMVSGAWAQAEILRCRFEPKGQPMTYIEFNDKTAEAHVQFGNPARWQRYKDVAVVNRQGYLVQPSTQANKDPFTLAAFNGILNDAGKPKYALLTFQFTNNASLKIEPRLVYPFVAHWGNIRPGAPNPRTSRGVCWTASPQMQAQVKK